jgi:hypothetical protein
MLQIFTTAVGELQRTFSDAFNPYVLLVMRSILTGPNFIICGGQDQRAEGDFRQSITSAAASNR